MVLPCFVRLRILLALLGVGGAVLMYRRGGLGQRVQLQDAADPLAEQAGGWALAEAPCTVGMPIVPVPADQPRKTRRLTLLSGGVPVGSARAAEQASASATLPETNAAVAPSKRKLGVRSPWELVASELLEGRALKDAAAGWRLEFRAGWGSSFG